MSDLSSLIRLHKYELDEKRRALAELYAQQSEYERKQRELERSLEQEKTAMMADGDVHFTFANYVESVQKKQAIIQTQQYELDQLVDQAKDSMMETFSELKKYEKTQEAREKAEKDKLAVKDAQVMDEIGIESHRRKEIEKSSK